MARLELLMLGAVLASQCRFSHADDEHGGGKAHSFFYWKGPVAGPAHPVEVQGGHGEHGGAHSSIDYVAHPKYEFAYGVTDHHTGDSHGQKESRDGDHVVGEYSVKEPSGNVRTVKYHADKGGFHAEVINSDGHHHSGGLLEDNEGHGHAEETHEEDNDEDSYGVHEDY